MNELRCRNRLDNWELWKTEETKGYGCGMFANHPTIEGVFAGTRSQGFTEYHPIVFALTIAH
jgi:hypothetical protein